jgi:hypothetical protein
MLLVKRAKLGTANNEHSILFLFGDGRWQTPLTQQASNRACGKK